VISDIAADVFLALAVLVVLASAAGLLVMRDVYQKLHFVTPAALVAPVLVGVAVLIESGSSANSSLTWLAVLFVVISAPYLSHATIRAARIREQRLGRDSDAAAGRTPAGEDLP
jgi:multisubunit Na+/H+ antiporter MnhG subunit